MTDPFRAGIYPEVTPLEGLITSALRDALVDNPVVIGRVGGL